MFADHRLLVRFGRFLAPIVSLMLVVAVFASPAANVGAAPDVGNASRQQVKGSSNVYLVRMAEEPVVAYRGGIPGLRATKAAPGAKINPTAPDVVRYVGYLNGRHDTALNGVGGGRKLYDYTYSFNGFAAELSASQAAKLAATPGVVSVTQDEIREADTSSTPNFLGLTVPGDGLWDQTGGVGSAGENIIIGVIDTGIWPEHPSFSDRTGVGPNDQNGKLDYLRIPGWHGRCVPGENFTADMCNQKLIGAQYFNAGYGGNAGVDEAMPHEFNSPRDFNGHGTHTASTAGGNHNVQATGAASVFGSISGIAPRARIAAYKALWHTASGSGSGTTSDLVEAIDTAVADGVDVINYSISGSQTNFMDPVEVSFLFAADAGVFVATSAGNSGPTASTVAHPSPWITTVAAGTHNRDGKGSVTLGNGATYNGASVATAVGPAPLIASVNAGKADATAANVELCFLGTLDPAKVSGKIVVCKRGVNARTEKSQAVSQAGGVGMILYNDPDSSLNADFHFVPTVHVNSEAGLAIKAYAATPGATATINQAEIVYNAQAPFTASFSSRGPMKAGGGDLLKPDLIAPGQDILAAVAPPGNNGRLFDLYSGTSMSSPHVAGLAALLKDLHPNWTPMMIKSALMTTGYNVLDAGSDATRIFRQGAGHVQPNWAADPGLVYTAGWTEWLGFLCGTGQLQASYCSGPKSIKIDPSDLNVPSIAIGDLAGEQAVTRKVTNVSGTARTFTASVSGMAGVNVTVDPSTLALAPGQSGTFKVTFTRTGAELNAYTGGHLTWTSDDYNVRIPLVVRPVPLAAPSEVKGMGATGTVSFPVKFGYTGSYAASPRGLVAAETVDGTVADDPTDEFVVGGQGIQSYNVTIPAGTRYARFSLFDGLTDGQDDLDLYVYSGSTFVGGSGSGTSAEQVNLTNPAAGVYTVYVHGWGTDGPDAQFRLFMWQVGADAGNLEVTAPATATVGAEETVKLVWNNLAAGTAPLPWNDVTPATKYLGAVDHIGATGTSVGLTIVGVDVP